MTLNMEITVPDRVDGTPTRFCFNKAVGLLKTHTEMTFRLDLEQAIEEVMKHEVDESIQFDSELVNNPHGKTLGQERRSRHKRPRGFIPPDYTDDHMADFMEESLDDFMGESHFHSKVI